MNDLKQYVIWDINEHTMDLVETLNERMDGTVTVINRKMTSGIERFGEITYAAADYVDSIKDLGFPVFHYTYLPPSERINNEVWYEFEEGGLVH